MNETELAKRFTDSFRVHEVMDREELDCELPSDAADPFDAAARILQAQAINRILTDPECLLHAPDTAGACSSTRRAWALPSRCSSQHAR